MTAMTHATSDIARVVVPGTFDPVTLGHIDVIRRARRICPKVTVAVAASAGKNGVGTVFTLEERVQMIQQALQEEGFSDIEVIGFRKLLVDLCHELGAGAVVKGLRATTDFEYELQQADLNARLAPDIESIFIMSAPNLGCISSSVVRELASFGSDVSTLVPPNVQERLSERYGTKK